MCDDHYVILIFVPGKWVTNYTVIFYFIYLLCKYFLKSNNLEIKFCDFEEYFMLKNALEGPFSQFLGLRQTYISLDSSIRIDQSI